MDTKAADVRPRAQVLAQPPVKPEDQELARKRDEQASLEAELAERELRSANLRAELGAFERQYLHFVGSRYAELDELKAQIAERLAQEQPTNERAQKAARDARARADATDSVAGEKSAWQPGEQGLGRPRQPQLRSTSPTSAAVAQGRLVTAAQSYRSDCCLAAAAALSLALSCHRFSSGCASRPSSSTTTPYSGYTRSRRPRRPSFAVNGTCRSGSGRP